MAPRMKSPTTLRIIPETLSPESFAPFGTVIENPQQQFQSSSISSGDITQPVLPPNAVSANQGTATKFVDVSLMTDFYGVAAPSKKASKAVMNMFACEPRQLHQRTPSSRDAAGREQDLVPELEALFDVRILERHPFTSQTFIPMGLDARDPSTAYLVVVAPSQPDSSTSPAGAPSTGLVASVLTALRLRSGLAAEAAGDGSTDSLLPSRPPDLNGLRAFLARGDQAVTYAAGTWHAPMVVLGARGIDFVVVQFANGVADEDCQEVEVWAGGDAEAEGGIAVVLDEKWTSKSKSDQEQRISKSRRSKL